MKSDHSRLGIPLLLFGVVFAFFQVFPSFLKAPGFNLLTWGDLLDLFTPLGVMSSLYLLYSRIKQLHPFDQPPKKERIAAKLLLAVGGLLYVDGHGMHLAANAVGRLVYEGSDQRTASSVYLLDEVVSHYIWDSGVILIAWGLMRWARRVPVTDFSRRRLTLSVCGGILFGFAFFANGVEGQTVPFLLPASGIGFLVALLYLIRDQRLRLQNPVAAFFITAFAVSLLLFGIWGILYTGFPQFSELGWI